MTFKLGQQDLAQPPFKLMLASDLGSQVAVTEVIRSLFADGSIVTGKFSDNRAMNLVVAAICSTRAQLATVCDAVAAEVDKATNTITWAPAGGQPMLIDTFRGQCDMDWPTSVDAKFHRYMKLTIPALPFLRTPTAVSLSGASAVKSILTVANSTSYTASNSIGALVGASSSGNIFTALAYAGPYPDGLLRYVVGPVTVTSVDLSACSQVTIARIAASYLQLYNNMGAGFTYPQSLTLGSSGGHSSTWPIFQTSSGPTGNDLASTISATPTATTSGGVNLAAVTSITFDVTFDPGLAAPGATSTQQFVSLTGYPASALAVSSTYGSVLKFPNVTGSARAKVALEVDRGGTNTMASLLLYRAPSGIADVTSPPMIDFPSGANTAVTIAAPTTYNGVYNVMSCLQAAYAAGTLTVQQKINGTNVGPAVALVGTYWPDGAGNQWATYGQLPLPIVPVPADDVNVSYTFTFSGQGANAADQALFLLDTRGNTIWVPYLAAGVKYAWADLPAGVAQLGQLYSGSVSARTDASSILASAYVSGGPISLDPGDNYLLAFSRDGAPTVTATYYPTWLLERTS